MSAVTTESDVIARLFPEDVVTAEVVPELAEGALYPQEEALVSNAVLKRRLEFTAGRLCARQALAKLGVLGFPILMSEDKTPIWPAGIVGSISHAAGYCGVALAWRGGIESVGLDIERTGELPEDCWKQVLTPPERCWLDSLPPAEQAGYVALIFSAKECLYKCQYPISKQWLDFHDLTISVDPRFGEFAVTANAPPRSLVNEIAPLEGKYLFDRGYVLTGMTLRHQRKRLIE
jgi:4'-phosphopantetheinyl transferase EntD